MEMVKWGVFGTYNSRLHGVFNTKEAAVKWADGWFDLLPGRWRVQPWANVGRDQSGRLATKIGRFGLSAGKVSLSVAPIVFE